MILKLKWNGFVEASKRMMPVNIYRSMTSDQLFSKQKKEAVEVIIYLLLLF